MGITKVEGFETQVVEVAAMLKALGHPARISIMKYLALKNDCVCGDIVMELPLAQPTVSRHLSELKAVGLIKGTISGKNICYCIDTKSWERLQSFLLQITQTNNAKSSCC